MSGQFDVDQLAARFRRVVTPPATALASAPSSDPGSTSRAPERRPAAPGLPTPGASDHPALAPGHPSPARRPKRRRWAPPTSPAERNAEPVDQPPTLYRCPHCGADHQPFPLQGRGLGDAFGRSLLSDSYADLWQGIQS
jgi:hypothetical protein